MQKLFTRSAIITTVSVKIIVMVITLLIFIFFDPEEMKCVPYFFCTYIIRTGVNFFANNLEANS